MPIIFSQQILSDKLLLAINSGQKSNFSDKFKLESITIYYLGFVVEVALVMHVFNYKLMFCI